MTIMTIQLPTLKDISIPTFSADMSPEELLVAADALAPINKLACLTEIALEVIDCAKELTERSGRVIDFVDISLYEDERRLYMNDGYDADGKLIGEVKESSILLDSNITCEHLCDIFTDGIKSDEFHVDRAEAFLSAHFSTKG